MKPRIVAVARVVKVDRIVAKTTPTPVLMVTIWLPDWLPATRSGPSLGPLTCGAKGARTPDPLLAKYTRTVGISRSPGPTLRGCPLGSAHVGPRCGQLWWSALAARPCSLGRVWVAAHDGCSAHRLRYPTALRLRTCQGESSQVGGSPQPLALRRLSPREPAIPVAHVFEQLGHLNTELSAGQLRVGAAITVLLRVLWVEQDGLLICAVSSDDAVTGMVLMISPSYSHRLLLRRDLLIRRDLHPSPLPAHSGADLPKYCSTMRSRRQH